MTCLLTFASYLELSLICTESTPRAWHLAQLLVLATGEMPLLIFGTAYISMNYRDMSDVIPLAPDGQAVRSSCTSDNNFLVSTLEHEALRERAREG